MPTSFLNLVDDNGTNSTGTLIDKAEFQALLMGASITSTSTGAVNNWAPGVDGHTLIEWNGAADATFSGLTLGQAGLTVTVKNVTTTKVAYFLHQSGLSSVGNKFTNYIASGLTPVAPLGTVTYRHDGTSWQIVSHVQGATLPWVPADGSGASLVFNVVTANYLVAGRLVYVDTQLVYPSTANASVAKITGLPFITAGRCTLGVAGSVDFATQITSSVTIDIIAPGGGTKTNTQMSLANFYMSGTYATT
jgi:hypothetical protein